MKISRFCLLVLLAIGSIGILKYSREAMVSTHDYRMVQRLEALAQSSITWSDATVALSLERHATQVALSSSNPASQDFRALINERRALSDSLFLQALAELANVRGFEAEDEFRQKAKQYSANVQKMRVEVDSMLAISSNLRPEKPAATLLFDFKAQILQFHTMSKLLVLRNNLTSSNAFIISSVRDTAWEIREFSGRSRTYYAIATLNQTGIPTDLNGPIKADTAHAARAWDTLVNLVESAQLDEAFLQSVAASEDRYFNSYLPVLAQLEAEMAKQPAASKINYLVDFDEFSKVSDGALDGIAQISHDAGFGLLEHWAVKKTRIPSKAHI